MGFVSLVVLSSFGTLSLFLWWGHGDAFLLVIGIMSFFFGLLNYESDKSSKEEQKSPRDKEEEGAVNRDVELIKEEEKENRKGNLKTSTDGVAMAITSSQVEGFEENSSNENLMKSSDEHRILVIREKERVGFLVSKTRGEFAVVEKFENDPKYRFFLYSKKVQNKEVFALRNVKTKKFLHRSHLSVKVNSAGRFGYHEAINMTEPAWIMYKNFFANPHHFYLGSKSSLCVGTTEHPLEFELQNTSKN